MIGLEAMGMSLEDIFINIVDAGSSEKEAGKSRRKYGHDERAIARDIMSRTAQRQSSDSNESEE